MNKSDVMTMQRVIDEATVPMLLAMMKKDGRTEFSLGLQGKGDEVAAVMLVRGKETVDFYTHVFSQIVPQLTDLPDGEEPVVVSRFHLAVLVKLAEAFVDTEGIRMAEWKAEEWDLFDEVERSDLVVAIGTGAALARVTVDLERGLEDDLDEEAGAQEAAEALDEPLEGAGGIPANCATCGCQFYPMSFMDSACESCSWDRE